MSVIAFFTTNGSDQSDASAPINYLMGPYSSLSQPQKEQSSRLFSEIKTARAAGDEALAHELTAQRSVIHGKRRIPPPVLLAGDPTTVTYAIATSPHKNKYSSGVIAHAAEDRTILAANPDIELEFRELMEALVFAGLPLEDRHILWVRHAHEQILENHFLIPRTNLRTGMYFNPHPPGAEADFNAVRDYLNAKHGLARPDDPRRKKLVASLSRQSPNRDVVTALYEEVEGRVLHRQLCNRQEVIDWLNTPEVRQAFGIGTIEAKRDYIRIVPEGKSKAIRLKGTIFSSQFTHLDVVLPSITARLPPQPSLDELWQRVEDKIAKRRAFNMKRYKVTADLFPEPGPTREEELTGLAGYLEELNRAGKWKTSRPAKTKGAKRTSIREAMLQPQIELHAENIQPSLEFAVELRLIEMILKFLKAILALLGVNDEHNKDTIIRLAQDYERRAQERDYPTPDAVPGVGASATADHAGQSKFAGSLDSLDRAYQRQQRLNRELVREHLCQQQICRGLDSANNAIANNMAGAGTGNDPIRERHDGISSRVARIFDEVILNSNRVKWLITQKLHHKRISTVEGPVLPIKPRYKADRLIEPSREL